MDTFLATRRRRTAEESRTLILDVATRRLREYGLEGLNITGVAKEAGISHATLIHHFGSSGGMRDALADKMTMDLVADLVVAFDAHMPPAELAQRVFTALAEGGHAKLLAWRSIEGDSSFHDVTAVANLFGKLLDTTQKALGAESREQVQMIIYLVALASIGYGMAGSVLADALGMNTQQVEAFPEWMTSHIT